MQVSLWTKNTEVVDREYQYIFGLCRQQDEQSVKASLEAGQLIVTKVDKSVLKKFNKKKIKLIIQLL